MIKTKTFISIFSFLYCTLFSLSMYSQQDSMVYTEVEQMPLFPGCDDFEAAKEKINCSNQSLVQFLAKHIAYPEEAKAAGIQGTVYVSFVVDQSGKVKNPSILRSLGGGCDEAAMDVIKKMPTWQPGYDGGKPKAVKLNLPIQFYFEKSTYTEGEAYELHWGRLTGRLITQEELEENLNNKVFVRNPYGDKVTISELAFAQVKNKKRKERKSTGKITSDMSKLVEKLKKGQQFEITAAIQEKGKFLIVKRTYEIID